MLKQMITTDYDNFIKRIFAEKSELKNFFLRHERKELLIKNLIHQIQLCELSNKVYLKRNTITSLVEDVTRNFCRLAINHKEQQIRSSFVKLMDEFGNKIQTNANGEIDLPEGAISVERK